MERIVALDPGGTTGWAAWTNHDEEERSKFTCGQIGPDEHHKQLYDMLGLMRTSDYTIVCERFDYRNTSRAGVNLMSREYIGVTKLFVQEAEGLKGMTLALQTAAQGKGFVQDRHIKKLGLWSPGWKHAMDAMRHLLFYMVNTHERTPYIEELMKAGWK